MWRMAPLLLLLAFGSACGTSSEAPLDAASVGDAGDVTRPDATRPDATRPDAGPAMRPDTGPPPPRFAGLPTWCWLPPNSHCNPADNAGCEDGEACDVTVQDGRPLVQCFPPPADRGLGEACDNDEGPFCRGGLRCMEGTCLDTCCEDGECREGERCVPLDPMLGSLGVCREGGGGACQPSGGFCRTSADCCSMDCHIDHCH